MERKRRRRWTHSRSRMSGCIRVYPIAPYNQDAVYLEGHVLRPGRYGYRIGNASDGRDFFL